MASPLTGILLSDIGFGECASASNWDIQLRELSICTLLCFATLNANLQKITI
jgi:hypothetical protein